MYVIVCYTAADGAELWSLALWRSRGEVCGRADKNGVLARGEDAVSLVLEALRPGLTHQVHP
jgi:hypothetical protein